MTSDFEERPNLEPRDSEIFDAARRRPIRESSKRTTFRFTPWGLWMLSELSRYIGKSRKHVIDLWVQVLHKNILAKGRIPNEFFDSYFEHAYDSTKSKRRTQLVSDKTRGRLKEIADYYEISRDHALEAVLLFASEMYRGAYEDEMEMLDTAQTELGRLREAVVQSAEWKEFEKYLEKYKAIGNRLYDIDLVFNHEWELIEDSRTDFSDPLWLQEAPENPFALDPASQGQSRSMNQETVSRKIGLDDDADRKDRK